MKKLSELERSDFYFLIPFAAIIIIWTLLSSFKIINPVLISSPAEVIGTTLDLLAQQSPDGQSVLIRHITASLYRLFAAFAIAAGIGFVLGIAMGANRFVYAFFDPIVTLLMPIPGIAWAPIVMIWLGFGDLTIIAVTALATIFPIVYNAAAGVRSINTDYIWAAQSMGAGRYTLFFRVYIPSAAPYLITGLKLGLSRGWRTVIAVEMIAASLWGLGYMIISAREYLQPAIIYTGIAVLALIFYIIENGVISWIEKKTVAKWGMITPAGA